MKSPLAKFREIQAFLDEKDFARQGSEKSTWARRFAHFWVLVFRSFQKNRGPVRAASLAYTTLLALIPVLAVVVSVSTAFLQNQEEGQDVIQDLLDKFIETAAPQLNLQPGGDEEEVAISRAQVVKNINDYINRINSGTLGVTAGFALVFIAVTMLSAIESTFNDMWGVTQGRSWSARIVQYWAAITLGPMFIVSAVAFTAATTKKAEAPPEDAVRISTGDISVGATNMAEVLEEIQKPGADLRFATTNLATEEAELPSEPVGQAAPGNVSAGLTNVPEVVEEIQKPGADLRFATTNQAELVVEAEESRGVLGWARRFLGRFLLPFIVLSIFLMLFYKLMPATRVRWDAAAVGGMFGGCVLQLNSLFSVVYISKVVTYSKIYGGLGAVPIFLVGLYFSWLILLLGAQVAYAYQNRTAYVQEKQAETINQRGREFIALRFMTYIAHRFHLGQQPPTRLQLSTDLGVPYQLACSVLVPLVNAGLLVEIQGEESSYTPGRPLDRINEEQILTALRTGQGSDLATTDDDACVVVREEYARVQEAEKQVAEGVTLQAVVMRLGHEKADGHATRA